MIRSRKLTRCIHADELRQMCIENNYFTLGDCDAYARLLNWINRCKSIESSDVMAIADYIYTYSDVEDECKMFGCTEDEYFNNVYFNIGEIVHWFCE